MAIRNTVEANKELIYRLSDGKIAEEWAADDLTAILYEIGAYDPPWLK